MSKQTTPTNLATPVGLTIPAEEFVQMKNTARILIEAVFQEEKHFIEHVMMPRLNLNWEEVEIIQGAYISGSTAKITLQYSDYSEAAYFISLDDVYAWYEKRSNELLNKQEK